MQDLGTAGHRTGDAELDLDCRHRRRRRLHRGRPGSPGTMWGFDDNRLIWTPNGGATWFIGGLLAGRIITKVRNTNPVEVVTTGHPFQTGDRGHDAARSRRRRACQRRIHRHPHRQLRISVERQERRGRARIYAGTGGHRRALLAVAPHHRGDRHRADRDRNLGGARASLPATRSTSKACSAAPSPTTPDGSPFWTITKISDTRFSLDGSDATITPDYVLGTGRVRGPRRQDDVPIQLVTNTTPPTHADRRDRDQSRLRQRRHCNRRKRPRTPAPTPAAPMQPGPSP